MGLIYSPKIVTSGLQLYLDAADRNSYPGSGTTWTDLITGIAFTPDNNTPDFNTTGISYVDFEDSSNPGDNLKSTSEYTGINTQNNYTRIVWFNFEYSGGNFKPIVGNLIGNNIDMGIALLGSKLHFRQYTNTYTSGTTSGDYGVDATTTITPGTWNQGVITVDRSAQSLKIYLNGNLDISTSINLIGNSYSATVMIGGPDADPYSGARMYDGKVASVMHYNRVLSTQEIQQNYNATKTRFGL